MLVFFTPTYDILHFEHVAQQAMRGNPRSDLAAVRDRRGRRGRLRRRPGRRLPLPGSSRPKLEVKARGQAPSILLKRFC